KGPESPRDSREQRQCVVTLRSPIAAISEHDDICDRHPLHLRRDRGSWLICCDSDDSRPTEVSVADDNLVCGHAVCGGTAEKCAARLAGVWKLDRSHDRFVGTGGFGDLDAALY